MIQDSENRNLTNTLFIDDKTIQSVAWDSVWRMVCPLHDLGVQWKRNVQPFLPGEEHRYLLQTRWLDRLIRYATNHPEWNEACRAVLRKLPLTQDVLNLLSSKGVLQTADCFTLKQWLVYAKQLCHLVEQVFDDKLDDQKIDQTSEDSIERQYDRTLVQLEKYDWDGWLQKLDPGMNQSTSFSLSDLQDPHWDYLEQQRIRLEQALIRHTMQQTKRIYEQTSMRPNRNQQVYISKLLLVGDTDNGESSHANILERCLQCKDLRYVLETRDEIIFQVENDKTIESLQEAKILLQSQIDVYQRTLLSHLSSNFWNRTFALQQASEEIGKLDYFLAVVKIALEWDTWCWGEFVQNPVMKDGRIAPAHSTAMQIKLGWHPVFRMYHEQHEKARAWTRTSLDLGKVNVITGPNMGGKSVTLKTIGLIQILFQYGLPMPAKYVSSTFTCWVRFHGGDDSNEEAGLSSFGAELIRIADILQSPGKGLVLLDEVARSTNPEEGEALATAIVEHARETENVTVSASHFSRVGQIPNTKRFQIKGLQAVPESWNNFSGQVIGMPVKDVLSQLQRQMDYEVVPVIEGEVPRYALAIASLLGVSKPIIERGYELLQQSTTRTIK